MLALLSALVATTCVLASVRRLAWAIAPTWLDPGTLARAIAFDGGADWPPLRAAITGCRAAVWERDLLSAHEASDAYARAALIHEQLRELDWRLQRWALAPRVCARVAASTGFLFGCIALLRGLSVPPEDAGAALVPALDALAVGIAGASFCIAAHRRARVIVRERLAATNRLVERLEALPRVDDGAHLDGAPSERGLTTPAR
jgi:hypothetical protein